MTQRRPAEPAFPSVDNGASNAICRKGGFTLLEECDVEDPPGSVMRCNDWELTWTWMPRVEILR